MVAEVPQQIINGLVLGSVYVLIALGLSTVFGILEIPHFAHGSVATLGGYVTYGLLSQWGLPFFPAMLLAMPVGAALGVVLERVAYRPARNAPLINAFIIALGLLLILDNVMLAVAGPHQVIIRTGYDRVLHLGPVTIGQLRLLIIVVGLVLMGGMFLLLRRTKLGKAIRAVAQNRDASILMGIDANRISMAVFAISSALGVAAGAFVGALFSLYPSLGGGLVLKGFASLILGGMGSIPGAILGGFILGTAESIAAGFISSAYKDVIAFLVMITLMTLKPSGILGRSTL